MALNHSLKNRSAFFLKILVYLYYCNQSLYLDLINEKLLNKRIEFLNY